jgi:broad specificity phosphatase PhoE
MLPCPADLCYGYLLRHGATENNLAKPPRLQGRGLDSPLSAAGREQAEAAASALSAVELVAVFSSPLLRARETAEQIADPHSLSVQVVDDLIEVDVGQWEGRSWVDIARNDADRHQQFVSQPDIHGYRGGENLTQVRERVVPAIRQILADHVGQHVAIIAHNVVNRTFLGSLMGLSLAQSRDLAQSNCGINVIRYRHGKVKLLSMNSVFHLPEGVRSV